MTTLRRVFLSLVLFSSIAFAQRPAITSFSPTSGVQGSTITLTGTNFSATPDSNRVFIGGVRATVNSASATSLSVTLPQGAISGAISLSLRGFSVRSETTFFVEFAGSGTINTGSFAFLSQTEVGTNPHAVAAGDIDADGRADLLVVNQGSNTVSVLLNQTVNGAQTPNYDLALDLNTGVNSDPRSIQVADVDGDGRLDIVVGCANTIAVFRNTTVTSGSPSFAARVEIATPSGSTTFANQDIVLADLDRDGRVDIATATYGNNFRANADLYKNNSIPGTISFGTVERLTGGDNAIPYGIAVADVDGDGNLDVAVGCDYGSISSRVLMFRNTNSQGTLSSTNFALVSLPIGSAVSIRDVKFGRIDSDVRPDLIVSTAGNGVFVFRNTGSSGNITFASPINFSTLTNTRNSLLIADIDGDAREDIVISNFTASATGFVSVLKNSGSGTGITAQTFQPQLAYNAGNEVSGLTVADVNRNGRPDIIVANRSTGQVTTLLSRVGGNFPVVASFSPLSGRIGSTLTLNGSGFSTTASQNIVTLGGIRATVVTASATALTVTVPSGATSSPPRVTVDGITATTPQSFFITFADSGSLNAVAFSGRQRYAVGSNAYAITQGDFNADGKMDIAIVDYAANRAEVYLNTSTEATLSESSFGNPIVLNTGASSNPRSIVAADLDGDGRNDLVVGCAQNIHVFRNTGTGQNASFATALILPTPSGSATYTNMDIEVGDLDGDGRPDIASATYGNNVRGNAELFQNTSRPGSISFGNLVRVTSGDNAITYGVAIGDADGDGKNDLALTFDYNSASSVVRIYRNLNPTGALVASNFDTPINITLGGRPFDVDFAYLDSDSRMDLVIADNLGSLRVLRNTGSEGNIAFQTPISVSVPSGAYNIAIGDLDGDAKSDIVMTNYVTSGSGSMTILKNQTTTGTFNAASFSLISSPTAGDSPLGIALGDFNNDGKSDIAISNYSTTQGSFQVFQNRAGLVVPAITSFSPLSGAKGSSVTISGSGFSPTAQNNVVFFGAVRALVTSASTTSLVVTVPDAAVTAPIRVTVNGLTAESQRHFTPTFSGGSSVSETSFFRRTSYPTGSNPADMATGDFDGDGKPDVVVINRNDHTATVYRNSSSPFQLNSSSFQSAQTLSTGSNSSPRSVGIADLDHDGKLDIVVGAVGKVVVFRNTTTGQTLSFSSGTEVVYSSADNTGASLALALGDIDGDGKTDIAVTNYGTNFRGNIELIQNLSEPGTLAFAAPSRLASPNAAYSWGVVIADFDGDGKNDLAHNIDLGSVSTYVRVYRNIGSPGSLSANGFSTPLDVSIGGAAREMAVGFLDNDGLLDIVIANSQSSTMIALRNTSTSGNIGFATPVSYSSGTGAQSVSIGDINGDGRSDIVVSNTASTNGTLRVFLNQMTSAGAFTLSSFSSFTLDGQNSPIAGRIADYDADGKPDFGYINSATGQSVFQIYRNNIGEFGISAVQPGGAAAGAGVSISGFNFTGTPIVRFGTTTATVNNFSSTVITTVVPASLSPGKYLLTVQIGEQTRPAPDSFTVFSPVPTISSFSPVAADTGALVTLTGTNFRTTVSENTVFFGGVRASVESASATQLVVRVPRGAMYGPIQVICLGSSAISRNAFVPTHRGAMEGNNVDLLFSTLSPSTANARFSTNNITPRGMVVADFDGDGRLDMVIANTTSSGGLSLFRNTAATGSLSSASFAAVQPLASGSFTPISVVAGDVDNDGRMDLVVGCDSLTSTSSAVLVYRNTSTASGTISFAAPVVLTVRPIIQVRPIRGITLGDLDNDGRIDIVLGGQSTASSIGVIKNTSAPGTLQFESPIAFGVSNITESVAIADLDGDGRNDIISMNSQNIDLLRNVGATGSITGASFSTFVTLGTSASQFSTVAIGDLNNDGRPDLVYSQGGVSTNSTMVYRLNQSSAGTFSFDAPVTLFSTASSRFAYATSIADVDGDGKPDIAVASQSSTNLAEIRVIQNTSTTSAVSFTLSSPFTISTTSATPQGMQFADFDMDGKPDIAAVTNTGSGSNNILVMRNLNELTVSGFQSLQTGNSITGAPIGRTISITGRLFSPDFKSIVVRFGADTAQIVEGTPTALLVRVPGRTLQIGNTVTVTVRNANGTVATAPTTFTIQAPQVLITSVSPSSGGRGQTVTLTGQDFSLIPSENSVRFGTIDAAVSSSTDTQITTTVPAGLTPATNVTISVAVRGGTRVNASSQFTVLQPVPIISSITPLRAAVGQSVTLRGTSFSSTLSQNRVTFGAVSTTPSSVQGDSVMTVPVPQGASFDFITLTVNGLSFRSSQKFTPTLPGGISLRASGFSSRADIANMSSLTNAEFADIDGDGLADVVATSNSSFISIARNTTTLSGGNPTFSTRVQVAGGVTTRGLAIGDINGDGVQDIVTGDFGGSRVNLFINQSVSGSINFGTSTFLQLAANSFSQAVKIADIDGDGRADIVVGTNAGISVFRFLGGALNSSNFSRTDFTGTNDNNYPFFEIGDFNGDGRPDIVRMTLTTPQVQLFTNQSSSGTVSLSSAVNISRLWVSMGDVKVADFDQDGKMDFVVGSTNGELTFFRNTHTSGPLTSSSFTVAQSISYAPLTFGCLAVGDVDGDGQCDVVGYSTGQFNLFKNLGRSTLGSDSFSDAIVIVENISNSGAIPITLIDLNRDGKADIAFGNPSLTRVSVLANRNTEPLPPTITSFTPTSGGEGDAVTITGTNFETTPGLNTVRFNTTVASVSAASATSLSVAVPSGLTVGARVALSVQTIDGIVTAADSFTVLQADLRPIVTLNSAGSVGTVSAVVSGTVNPRGLSTTFRFEFDTVSTFISPSVTTTQNAGSGSTAISTNNVTLSGLLSGRTYFYRLTATNSAGTRQSNVLSFTTGALPIVETLTASNITTTGATLRGTVNARGISTNVFFQWGTSSGNLSNTTSVQTTSSSAVQNFQAGISFFNVDQTYFYRIVATNSNGTSNGNVISFVPVSNFPRPTSPSLFSTQTPQVTFQWSSFNEDDQFYELELATSVFSGDEQNPDLIHRFTGIRSTQYTVYGLPSPATIYWRVRGRTTAGTFSPWSSSSSNFAQLFFQTNSNQSLAALGIEIFDTRNELIFFTTSGDQLRPENYKLFGLPGGDKPISIVGGRQGVTWRAFSDNGQETNFLRELSGEQSIFRSGLGYWMLGSRPLQIPYNQLGIQSGSSRVLVRNSNSATEFRIPLNPDSWTIISNPYLSPIQWSQIRAANSLTENAVIWSYENGTWQQAQTMEPFKAYYYRTTGSPSTEQPSLRLPASLAASPATTTAGGIEDGTLSTSHLIEPPTGESWQASLTVSTGRYTDRDNRFGVDHRASDAFDEWDVMKPPFLEGQPGLVFKHPEWETSYSLFAHDIRHHIGEGSIWTVSLFATVGEWVSLKLEHAEQIPGRYRAHLINENGVVEIQDLRRNPVYRVKATNPEMQLSILIGTSEFLHESVSRLLPKEFALEQNYPNPFNPSTLIPIQIPVRSRVNLEVYDLLGRKVATLLSGIQEAGMYRIPFNAVGLSSGVYFYRLNADPTDGGKSSFAHTKKMIFIK